jgi:serine/threonine protein kinase
MEKYKVLEVIGCKMIVNYSNLIILAGGGGTVYKVRDKKTKQILALKKIEWSNDSAAFEKALLEIKPHLLIRSPHIVAIEDFFFQPKDNNTKFFCIVMEFCECGDLLQYLKKRAAKMKFVEPEVMNDYNLVTQCN